jgi:hypothetical protein
MSNLYLVTQNVFNGYDTYNAMVVTARSETAARKIHPWDGTKWDGKNDRYGAWPASRYVNVAFIGTSPLKSNQIILTSFRNS